MQRKSFILTVLAILLGMNLASPAELTIYTDKTQWQTALAGLYMTEEFSDSQLNQGVSFVSTESGHINPAQGYYQDVLATESQNAPITVWSFTPAIIAYGGNWTLGGPGGSGNSLLVYLADSSLYVGAISNSYGGEFWGFISDTPFTSVKLVGGSGLHQQNYQLDNMVYSFYCPYVLAGDLNGNCRLDVEDLAILAAAWLSSSGDPAWNPACDLAAPPDETVNLLDFSVLAGHWLLDCHADPSDPACLPGQ